MSRWPGARWDAPADGFALALPFLDRAPRWLVLGGLGMDDDWRKARAHWPEVKIVGVDPDPRCVAWQQAHGWPEDCPLVEAALSNRDGRADINMGDACHASVHPRQRNLAGAIKAVPTVKLDSIDREMVNVVLWLDLEDWEWPALEGAKGLLQSGRVLLVNWEARRDNGGWNRRAAELLESFGFVPALVWFQQWWGHNEIWVPR